MPNGVFRKLSQSANSFRRNSRIFSDKETKNAAADSNHVNGATNGTMNGISNGTGNGHDSRTVAVIPEEPASSNVQPVKSTPVDQIPAEVHANGVSLPQILKDLGKQV